MMTRLALIVCLLAGLSQAQPGPAMIGMGDSLGEGVQSADANLRTQPNTYLNLIARQMGVPFPLPLIVSNALGVVGGTALRHRLDPAVAALDLAISGADSSSILTTRPSLPIDSETDLVLLPRTGSQIEIAEALKPSFIVCWIGSNDILGAELDFNHLDASQMTDVATFASNYGQLVNRLAGIGSKVVLANIVDVTQIGFLVNRSDLIRFLGSDFGLPQDSLTSIVAMLLIKLGLVDGSILQNPDWVLDANEISQIRQRVQAFNQIISDDAAQAGMPVVDVNGLYQAISANPPVILGVTLTNRYLGGLFSLDGVHPSDTGHAILANAFINKVNSFYHMNVPTIGPVALLSTFLLDPFVDFDGDLKVRGRPLAGLLETLGPVLGISGDQNESLVTPAAKITPALGQQFMQQYLTLMGKAPNSAWTQPDAFAAFRNIFGIN